MQTDPTQRASIRRGQHIQQRRIQTDHQMRRPPNHKKSKEETNRHYIREEPAAPDQRLSTDITAEQNTLIKVIYCKTAYLIRLGLYRIPVYSGFG
jgi:hypothetical protein